MSSNKELIHTGCCISGNFPYLAPRYVWSRVSTGFTGDDQLPAHLLEILRSRRHAERWRVLQEEESLFTFAC